MPELTSPRWRELSHAYGSAEQVPEWLEELPRSNRAWTPIWSALCHQGSVYSATYAAVPHILALAAADAEKRVVCLSFLGAVAASIDADPCPDDLREAYDAALREAEKLSIAELRTRRLSDDSASWLLALVAGARGDLFSANAIDAFPEAEYEIECPHCGEYVNVLAEDGDFTLSGEMLPSRDAPRASVDEPLGTLPNRVVELCSLAEEADAAVLASLLRKLYALPSCPHCSRAFSLAAALSESYMWPL